MILYEIGCAYSILCEELLHGMTWKWQTFPSLRYGAVTITFTL